MIGESLSHFTITAKLGEGGMGEVWRAEDTKLGREVALKVLPPAFAGDAERMGRFAREAQVLASLNHPHIAQIYGLEEAAGRRALVMELVEGETLQERIRRGPLPLDEALRIALQIAHALEAAHEKGIVHRDLKPANVKLTPEGQVKVLDFGLAKALEEERPQGDLANSPTLTAAATQAGIILGTAAYMSPEQAAGQMADRRADIWSFGVVLTEMLTGSQQFTGETVSHVLAAVLQKDIDLGTLPADTPAPIVDLIEHCLRKKAKQRLQAIGDARILIEDYLAAPESFAAPQAAEQLIAPAAVAPVWKRLLPWTIAALATIVAGMAWFNSRTPDRQPVRPMRFEVAVAEEPWFAALGAAIELSPDERYVASVTGEGDVTNLHLRALDQMQGMLVQGGSAAADLGAYHPFFSPDGQWLGYVTPGSIRKVPVTGGTPIELCQVTRSRGASWSPDGTIVFAGGQGEGLSRVSENGGAPEALTTLDASKNEVSHRWPQVIAGGRAVVFTSQVEGASGYDAATIELLDLDSGERRVLHRGGTYGRVVEPGFLVYANNNSIFAVPFDMQTLEVEGSAAPVVQGVAMGSGEGGAQFAVSGSGTLAYVAGNLTLPEYPIVWVSREGALSTLWQQSGVFAAPRISPEGRRLALTVMREENWDIWVFDLEREVPTRLTFAESYDGDPVWSPDGEWIVFTSDRGGVDQLHRKRSDGSGEVERLIESDHSMFAMSWSSDGRLLAGEIQQASGNLDLWVMPAEGGEVEIFLASEFVDRYPAFSPDGRWIAYQSSESGQFQVYVRPYPPAGGKWQISDEGGGLPLWSPDGSQLFYRTNEGVMAVDIESAGGTLRTGRPRPLFINRLRGGIEGMSVAGFQFTDYDIAPDGERFVMFPQSADEGRGSRATFVLHWTDELVRTFGGRQ